MEVFIMKKNVGTVDQIVRFIIGAVIIAAGYYYGSWWGLLGLLVIATATFSFCPAYVPFGISTCKGKGKKK
jgi:hypothetical protein